MANVYSVAFSVAGIILMHTCLLVWAAVVVPRPVERARHRLEAHPLASLIAGLGCCLLIGAFVGGFMLIRPQSVRWVSDSLEFLSESFYFTRFYNDAWIITNLIVWLPATPLLAAFVVGGAGFAQLFADRARAMTTVDRPLAVLTYGALCISASYFLPVVGWFVFLPLVGLMSIGSGAQGLWGHFVPRAEKISHAQSRVQDPVLSRL